MHPNSVLSIFLTRLAVIAGLSAFACSLSGQTANHMILIKNGYKNKVHYLSGDPITFVRAGNDFSEEFYIQGIGKDYIIVGGEELPTSKIALVIRRRTAFNFDASGKALMIAAPGYLLIGVINSLFQGVSPVPSGRNLIVAGALLGTGIIVPGFQVRKYRMGKKFSLKIVESDPALNR